MTELGRMLAESAARALWRIVVIAVVVGLALGGVVVWAWMR